MARYHATKEAAPLVPGRRTCFTDRDLGVTEASQGQMRAQVMAAITGMTEPTGWHYHVCDGQFVYALKGWVELACETGDLVRPQAGESRFIPGGLRCPRGPHRCRRRSRCRRCRSWGRGGAAHAGGSLATTPSCCAWAASRRPRPRPGCPVSPLRAIVRDAAWTALVERPPAGPRPGPLRHPAALGAPERGRPRPTQEGQRDEFGEAEAEQNAADHG